jgi:hypothetical protein
LIIRVWAVYAVFVWFSIFIRKLNEDITTQKGNGLNKD